MCAKSRHNRSHVKPHSLPEGRGAKHERLGKNQREMHAIERRETVSHNEDWSPSNALAAARHTRSNPDQAQNSRKLGSDACKPCVRDTQNLHRAAGVARICGHSRRPWAQWSFLAGRNASRWAKKKLATKEALTALTSLCQGFLRSY